MYHLLGAGGLLPGSTKAVPLLLLLPAGPLLLLPRPPLLLLDTPPAGVTRLDPVKDFGRLLAAAPGLLPNSWLLPPAAAAAAAAVLVPAVSCCIEWLKAAVMALLDRLRCCSS
jgi:hypothetical protein